jgi:hypothetical protein
MESQYPDFFPQMRTSCICSTLSFPFFDLQPKFKFRKCPILSEALHYHQIDNRKLEIGNRHSAILWSLVLCLESGVLSLNFSPYPLSATPFSAPHYFSTNHQLRTTNSPSRRSIKNAGTFHPNPKKIKNFSQFPNPLFYNYLPILCVLCALCG